MDVMNGITAALAVLCAIVFGVALYFKVKGNVFAMVSELIALAESTGMTGIEKMDQVVTALYEKVPMAFRKILTFGKLESIAQGVFNWMRVYAEEYRAKKAAKEQGESKQDVAETVGIEAKAALIADLLALTLTGLKEKAEEYGIEPEGLTTKHDYTEVIVKTMLEKM